MNRRARTEPVGRNVETPAIHRIIEQHVAGRGDAVAIAAGRDAITYRYLNQRANLVARRLHDAGFCRGGHATICMPRTPDLAVVLLAVLKAGGAYTWDDGDHGTVSIAPTPMDSDHTSHSVDVAALLEGSPRTCANLPIVTRGTDIACVLRRTTGQPAILVPHATVTALCVHTGRTAPAARWHGDAAAIDLWFVLTAGGTVVLNSEGAEVAAA
jgi:non-ribosomal peptide synthetase component F